MARSQAPLLGRLLLPAFLFAAAVGTWFVAHELGSTPAQATVSSGQEQVTTPLASVRRVPEFATSTTQQERIASAVAALPEAPTGLFCAVVLVDGEPVLEVQPDQTLVGGYAQQLFVGHAAIDVLGADFRYETQVLARDLPDENGRIGSGIYLIGSGDPGLSSWTYTRTLDRVPQVRTSLDALAQAVADAGVVRIDGGVIAAERRYDTDRGPAENPLIGPLSAVQVDDGYLELEDQRDVFELSAEPAIAASERLAQLLERTDVEVTGLLRPVYEEEELPSLVPVASVQSPPLSDIVRQTWTFNDATASELLVKELGVATRSQGTTQAGGQAIQQVLTRMGVDVPVAFRDGSGLDPFASLTCRQLVTAMDQIPQDHPTIDALPGSDSRGVFSGRLTRTDVDADVRVVGGIFDEGSSLVGRTVDEGPRVSFATILNRTGGPRARQLGYQQALVDMVDALRDSVEPLEISE